MMADSTLSTLDESLNMSSTSGVTLIEFNEQQKASIAAALQAVSDQLMPGNIRRYAVEHSHYNTNVTDSMPKQGEIKTELNIPNLSKAQHSNQQVQLMHNLSPCVGLTKEGTQPQENITQLHAIKIEENNLSYSADHKHYNTNVTQSIPKQEENEQEISIPNLSNEQHSNQHAQLTYDLSPFDNLTKEEPQPQDNMSQFQTIRKEENICIKAENVTSEEEVVKRINDDKSNDKYDAENSQESDDEATPTIDYSKFIDYICPKCNKNCGPYANWKSHTEEEHQFNTSSWFKLRTINKNGKQIYQCLVCMEELSHSLQFNQLQAHFIKHLPYNEYLKCNICCQKFKQIHNVKDHIRNFHRKACRQNPKVQLEIDTDFIDIFCPICQQLQLDRNSWWQHLKERHNYAEEIKSKITEEEKNVYSCKVCKQKLRHNSIKNHMLWHEKYKSFKCKLCKKESATIGNAVSHKRNIHFRKEQDKPFKCTHCKQSFKNLYLRRKHISEFHSEGLPKCSICKKWFYSITFLLDHMKRENHYPSLYNISH